MGIFRKDLVIKRPILKEDKAARLIALDVDPKARAADVKAAFEKLYKVKVEEVGFLKEERSQVHKKRRDWRKAYVRLKEVEGDEALFEVVPFSPKPANHVVDLVRAIEDGLPMSALDRFQAESTLPMPRVLRLVRIPARTYARRRDEGRLTAEESDRLMRVTRLFSSVTTLFNGDVTAAVEWLSKPLRALGGAIPLDIAETETGSHEVERVIQQLEHGVFP